MDKIVNQTDIARLIAKDKLFDMIYSLYGPPPDWSRPPGFGSLAKIILEQQVSLASANAHFKKLNSYVSAFSPSAILTLSDVEMRNCQISRQKAKYLRALSTAIVHGDIDLTKFSDLEENEVRNILMSIKGIGHWTSDIYLMFCMQARDIFPMGDIAVINTVKELKSARNPAEILLLTENWKPLRSLAGYFCWHYYLKKRNRPSEYI